MALILSELSDFSLLDLSKAKEALNIEWTDEELMCIGHSLCSTLASIQRAGVYHSDIKPANITAGRVNNYTTDFTIVKFIDFGVSQIIKPDSQCGKCKIMVAGTPNYMAPPIYHAWMTRGDAIVDPFACDAFSLGMTLLRLLQPAMKREQHFDAEKAVSSIDESKYGSTKQLIRRLMMMNDEYKGVFEESAAAVKRGECVVIAGKGELSYISEEVRRKDMTLVELIDVPRSTSRSTDTKKPSTTTTSRSSRSRSLI